MENQNNNEMNLFDLIVMFCRAIKRFFVWCGISLLHLVRFSIQNIWIILAFVVASGILGFIFTQPQHTTYKGSATVLFVQESSPLIHDYIKRIDLYSGNKNMSAELGMPDSLAKSIEEIKAYNWIDYKNDGTPDKVCKSESDKILSDTNNVIMNDRVYLQVKAKGMYNMRDIQAWLQQYFDQRAELTPLTEHGRMGLQARINAYTNEIVRLDSLATYEYFNNQSNKLEAKNGVVMSNGRQLYYEDILKLIDKRSTTEAELNMRTHNINFQNDIIVTSASPRWLRFAIWVMVGYILGALLALAIKNRLQIADYLKE